jgi:exonuclease VII small subunit
MRLSAAPLIVMLALPLALVAATPSGPARPAAPAAAMSYAEPHPEINAAIRSLERAKLHLQKAAHDFGGHRVEAIRAIDGALEQLKLALQYDKN